MNEGFIDLRQNHAAHMVEESFWPSFTDIMTVVVMIFLIATSILIVKNWELVDELQTRIEVEQKISQRLKASIVAQKKTYQELQDSLNKRQEISRKLQLSLEAERRTSEAIQKTTKEKMTLEETLTQTQSELSLLRLKLMHADESARERDRLIMEQDKQLSEMQAKTNKLVRTIESRDYELTRVKAQLIEADKVMSRLQSKLELNTMALTRKERELKEQQLSLGEKEKELLAMANQNQEYIDSISNYERQIAAVQQQHSILVGEYENLEDRYNKLIKPSRSALGKYVVEVRFDKYEGKHRIQFRQSESDAYLAISEAAMHEKLTALKEQYKDTLYVKIIIPDDSGLSYNEAWTFMSNILNQYDYYYQD